MDRGAGRGRLPRRPGARAGSADARDRARPALGHRPDRVAQHAVRQHDPGRPGAAVPGRQGARVAAALGDPLERDGDGRARQQGLLGARRPHRLLPVAGDALRGRLQPLLARAVRRSRRRPRLFPGPLLPRQLRARVPGGPADDRAAGQLPPGGRRQRPVVVSAPVADARLLAVPDGVAGDRRDQLDLPGAVHEVPGQPRPRRHRRPQGVGVPRRRRDGRARIDGCRSRWPAASTSTT